MINFLKLFIDAAFSSNIVLMGFLGICSFLGVSTKTKNAFGMSMAVMFVLTVSVFITYPVFVFILQPLGITYMQTIVFILVIASLVQLLEMFTKRFSPTLYKGLGVYLALIATNCLILNGTIDASKNTNFGSVVAITLGTGFGYFIVMMMFSAIREKLDKAKTPKAFKGIPIALICTSIMALAFAGLRGIV